jgi:hypothetical protein
MDSNAVKLTGSPENRLQIHPFFLRVSAIGLPAHCFPPSVLYDPASFYLDKKYRYYYRLTQIVLCGYQLRLMGAIRVQNNMSRQMPGYNGDC